MSIKLMIAGCVSAFLVLVSMLYGMEALRMGADRKVLVERDSAIMKMEKRIENLEGVIKAQSRTNWVVFRWEESSNGVDLVTITDPSYGDHEKLQIFVSQQYTDQLLGWVEGMIRPAVGRWSSHSLARLTGKKAVFNPIKSGPSYGHNLVFGGLLEFSVVN